MTRDLRYLLAMIIVIGVGIYFYFHYCSECGTNTVQETEVVEKEVVTIEEPGATALPFAFTNNDYAFETQDNFNFNLSSETILTPLSGKVEEGVASLKSYLSENPDKVINITGYYKGDETNNTAFSNLGLARANKVKNHLVAQGISSTQTNTFGKLKDDFVPDDNVLLGPLTYTLDTKANDSDELKALYDDIRANPLVLYFNTGEAAINLTAEQREKVSKISRYLDKVDGATCDVVGHTDSAGGRAINIRLGQERADFAKAYLSRNGIPEARIETSSQGPDAPIATNATAEGKAKNRRTVVTLK